MRAGAAIAWFAVFFLCAQAALALAMERWRSEFRDPELGRKLGLLQARLSEHPERPLLLMLGSSRTLQGFQPRRFEGMTAPDGQPVVAFNFGLTGVGPMKELACLHRLRREGIRPALLLVEVLPALLNEPGTLRISEEMWLNPAMLSAADLALLRSYHSQRKELVASWARARLLPWYSYRLPVMESLAPKWVPPEQTRTPLGKMDRFGWQPFGRDSVTAEERGRLMEQVRTQYGFGTREFRIGAGPRRALGDVLEFCRQENIRIMLILMPEAEEFRRLYSPGMKASLPQLLADVRECYGATVIDARTWIADDCFWDAHHLMPHGAAQFTERLREVVSRAWREP